MNLSQSAVPLRLPKKATELAYLAGIFDGEGGIVKRTVKGRAYYGISIANSDVGLVKWLGSLGGGITINAHPRTDTRTCYSWYITRSEEVVLFLRAVLPYLIVKKNDAIEKLDLVTARLEKSAWKKSHRDAEIKRLRLHNLTHYEIADRVGCARGTVRKVLNATG